MNEEAVAVEELETFTRLTKDLKESARGLSEKQARYLVDTYYQVQQFRIDARGQERAAEESREPHLMTSWIAANYEKIESSIVSALNIYSDAHQAGRWAKSVYGIGPVIAAGLLAHVDPAKARTAGGLWKFAGLDPSTKWGKGEKRPWNAALKVLCWKIGESFVKFSNKERCYYGKVYKERKVLEIQRNADGRFADQAAQILLDKKFVRDTMAKTAYESGHLPDGHIHSRAKRVAVKLFLAHYLHVAYEAEYGIPPPAPYPIAILGHVGYLEPPGWNEMKKAEGIMTFKTVPEALRFAREQEVNQQHTAEAPAEKPAKRPRKKKP